ncbi:ferric reductase-like transmembrane domain-containing protein [Heliophilum fasciatum]|uniref:Ferric reductase like protein n=1 Tax=Heliophilum fasciatum TaxID=35700 RepID=A0A4R2RI38_9FIRM|nr:ferric reductase-like transmembrane domain-containing protein [Heliophilum fasciatum]MCW2278625.1 hypothetical protein [Heliophilum fasciatum]TCP62673.1 hypothetical protein EDD73_11921 [Heliophilum fasciatum]
MRRWGFDKLMALFLTFCLGIGSLAYAGGPAWADDDDDDDDYKEKQVTSQSYDGQGQVVQNGERSGELGKEGRPRNPVKGASKAIGLLSGALMAAAAVKWPLRLVGWKGYKPLWHKWIGGIAVIGAVAHGVMMYMAEGKLEPALIAGGLAGTTMVVGALAALLVPVKPESGKSWRKLHIGIFVFAGVLTIAHLLFE